MPTLKECYLNTERHSFFAAMFLGRELGGDAVDFDVEAGVLGRVPHELERVGAVGVGLDVDDAVRQRDVCSRDGATRYYTSD